MAKNSISTEDIIGQTFGHLTVIAFDKYDRHYGRYFLCKCDCSNHTIKSVRFDKLKNGDVKSCGCARYEKPRYKDLTGLRVGKLLVVDQAGRDKDNKVLWKCKCDCGNEIIVDGHRLTRKNQKKTSCGKCIKPNFKPRYKNLVGMKFGELEVIELDHLNRQAYWKCLCHHCGNYTVVTTGALTSNHTKSCGCLAVEHMRELGHIRREGKKEPHVDLTGNKYNMLTAIEYVGDSQWKCQCDCGRFAVVDTCSLKSGRTKSCGNHGICSVGSLEENEIRSYIEAISGKEFRKDKKILDGKEIDMYNQELALGIEYNGSLFHATKNGVYNNKHKLYHRNKFLLAKAKGIHLLNIFDVDWKNNQEKIKMYLNDLVVNKTKVFARNCVVQCVDRYISDYFCDKYHLQGHSRMAKINYGLFYNNELISVMCFGNLRQHAKQEGCYELHRYCVKAGITVIGGANKLFKAFLKQFCPSYILSYSDNDYFLGTIYPKLGFTYAGQTNPRYYWYYGNTEVRRERCQLKYLSVEYPELYEKSLSMPNKEDFIMTQLNACKVYRSGNSKWEYKLKA